MTLALFAPATEHLDFLTRGRLLLVQLLLDSPHVVFYKNQKPAQEEEK